MIKNSFGMVALTAGALIICLQSASAQERPRHADAESKLVVEHAEVILALSGAKMLAGYITVWNGSKQQSDLVSVQSDDFASVSLHRTEVVDGVAKMRPIKEGIFIPGHAELLMKPGGIHMMLMAPTVDFKPGDKVDLLLAFADGASLSTTAITRPIGTKPIDHHHGSVD
ncbi:copper chaperone PCu(A)C [Mesorhizobium sp. STM 4661]|uniref:copper chaperone PCu(A)C n=1 Tax=Mesorhizobium sp. STM 4661 TaxID=1297570 RepID=UPI0002BD6156|nr:copper chaperone PCu(A)C [Mesorhizobium sp. STM 4661]CCV11927.1 exported hypothetical protein [Mesorhizobium sp. STM 4661]